MNTRVKMFTGATGKEVQDSVNAWLEENPTNQISPHVSIAVKEGTVYVFIVYRTDTEAERAVAFTKHKDGNY